MLGVLKVQESRASTYYSRNFKRALLALTLVSGLVTGLPFGLSSGMAPEADSASWVPSAMARTARTTDPEAPKPVEHWGWFSYKKQARKYLLHVPPKYEAEGDKEYPLVVCLHGGGADIGFARRMFNLGETAAKDGFIVAYPNGSGRVGNRFLTWNASECCGFAKAHKVDDVGFVKAFVEMVSKELKVDRQRIYLVGFSNGAQMAYRMAAEAPDTFAAVSIVSGSMSGKEPTPEKPVPMVIFHGTSDRHIPVAGGGGKLKKWGFDVHAKPLDYAVKFWVKVNGCEATPQVEEVNPQVTRTRYNHGKDGAEVILYTLKGYGHAWPGGKRAWLFAEAPCRTFSANDAMWDFFTKHTRTEFDVKQASDLDNAKCYRR
jgi:polyhydroxybutyrate depolymerase